MGKEKLKSETISDFLNLMLNTPSVYSAAYKAVNEEDKLAGDLLHEIELDGTTRAKRSKTATALRTNRLDRRYYKDIVEEYSPLNEYLKDGNNDKAVKKLMQVLGDVRKAEKYHADRKYKPRVDRMNNVEQRNVSTK